MIEKYELSKKTAKKLLKAGLKEDELNLPYLFERTSLWIVGLNIILSHFSVSGRYLGRVWVQFENSNLAELLAEIWFSNTWPYK